MDNLDLTIGQELTLGELATIMSIDFSQVDDYAIWKEESTSIDNFNGKEGWNVYFDIIEKEKEKDYYEPHNWKIKITDINYL